MNINKTINTMTLKDFDNFDYNKTYKVRNEHKWDVLKKPGKIKEYKIAVANKPIKFPNVTPCQYNVEYTGQLGNKTL